MRRIAPRFARSEPRARVLAYVEGCWRRWSVRMAGSWPSRRGRRPRPGCSGCWRRGVGRRAVRDDLRAYVVEHLGDRAAVLVVDETGFLKKGTKSVGVQRQYSGTAGRIENCQIGVFLAYATAAGPDFLDRELYLPKGWADDRGPAPEAGVPARVAFATKPRAGAGDAGARARRRGAGRLGDGRRGLRPKAGAARWLEERAAGLRAGGPVNQPGDGHRDGSGRRSCGDGWPRAARGRPLEDALGRGRQPRARAPTDWARVPARPAAGGPATGCWRGAAWPIRTTWPTTSSSAPADHALRRTGPGGRHPLGDRGGFEIAKGEVGLDQYEVRRWDGWYRHITLALLAHAFLTVVPRTPGQPAQGGRAAMRRGPHPPDAARGPPAARAPPLAPATCRHVRSRLVPLAPSPPGARPTLPLHSPRSPTISAAVV